MCSNNETPLTIYEAFNERKNMLDSYFEPKTWFVIFARSYQYDFHYINQKIKKALTRLFFGGGGTTDKYCT